MASVPPTRRKKSCHPPHGITSAGFVEVFRHRAPTVYTPPTPGTVEGAISGIVAAAVSKLLA
eukprot:3627186-Karenia_brevis.AAC.1